jgi:hypothetical protein
MKGSGCCCRETAVEINKRFQLIENAIKIAQDVTKNDIVDFYYSPKQEDTILTLKKKSWFKNKRTIFLYSNNSRK